LSTVKDVRLWMVFQNQNMSWKFSKSKIIESIEYNNVYYKKSGLSSLSMVLVVIMGSLRDEASTPLKIDKLVGLTRISNDCQC
jgi:hypothetical protein